MNLGTIQPHPDFPSAMRIMRGTVPGSVDLVTRIMVDPHTNRYCLVGEFEFSWEELQRAIKGQPLRLSILGPEVDDPEALAKLGMPHVALWVRGEDEI